MNALDELSIDELDRVAGGDNVISTIMKSAWAAAEAVGKAVTAISNAIPDAPGSGAGSGGSGVAPQSTWL